MARDTAAAQASTGQIGLSNFEGLIAISKRFADALNLDGADANKQLAASFADPPAQDFRGRAVARYDGRRLPRLARGRRVPTRFWRRSIEIDHYGLLDT